MIHRQGEAQFHQARQILLSGRTGFENRVLLEFEDDLAGQVAIGLHIVQKLGEEKIREILISPAHNEMHNECELLLYLAARAQHIREKIVPALEKGAIVLCDRFQMATFAYQGFGRSLPMPLLKTINDFATGGVAPDITFVFTISVEASFKRLKEMNKRPDRLELTGADFFSRISQGYRTLALQDPLRTVLIDGDQPVDTIAETVGERIHAAMASSVN